MSQIDNPDAAAVSEKPAALPLAEMARPDLASLLAARLCHDFISPASAIVSGLDLLEDPEAQDMRDDAMALIAGSARKLVDLLQFARIAFGGGGAESFSREELEGHAKAVFAHHRGDLEWSMTPAVMAGTPGRVLLNLCALAAAALPMGGTARIEVSETGGEISLLADCRGNRARLRPELLAALNGEGPGEGLAGHWIQAAWTQEMIMSAGGTLETALEADHVRMSVRLPAG
jgi:histidine phosphotransferase ChpT